MSFLASDLAFSFDILFISIWLFFTDANLLLDRVFKVVKRGFEAANITFLFERVDSAACLFELLNISRAANIWTGTTDGCSHGKTRLDPQQPPDGSWKESRGAFCPPDTRCHQISHARLLNLN